MNRRSLLATFAGAGTALLGGSAHAQSASPEFAYWLNQAALLDPLAYVLRGNGLNGPSWKETVPTGETWYCVAAFNLIVNHTANWYQREFDARMPLTVPQGTTIGPGAVWCCRPALVATSDRRYTDPKALYYGRIQRLGTLRANQIKVELPGNSPHGAIAQQDFPLDFDFGMLLGAQIYEASWVSLNGWNLLSEINNDHSVRFSRTLLAPFPRVQMPNVKMMGGSHSGNSTDLSQNGHATVIYAKLPADW